MNPVRKRLRLSPSKPPAAAIDRAHSVSPPRPGPQLLSNDAPLLPHTPAAPAGGGAEDEEGYLLVEEDTTDSSLIITMGNTHKHTDTGAAGTDFGSGI